MFNGTIDEAALYDKTPSALQVRNHYDKGVSTAVGVIAPSGLSANATSSSAAKLTWTDNANNETGFVLQRASDSAFTSPTRINVDANATTYIDTGLTGSTTYYYRLKAVTATDSSNWTATTSAATPAAEPAAPSGLAATASSSSTINLKWTDNANNETGFLLQRSRDNFATTTDIGLGANATGYSDSGLAAATDYSYRVRALNGSAVSAWSTAATATTSAAPPPTTASYASTVTADAPVSWWRLGETSGTRAADARNANPGTYAALRRLARRACRLTTPPTPRRASMG